MRHNAGVASTADPALASPAPHGAGEAAAPEAALRVGVAVWLLSETMFFGGLFAAYFTLRAADQPWPPAGVHLDTLRALVFTLLLVASSFTMHRAVQAAERARPTPEVLSWIVATLVLGTVFITNQALEYTSLDFTMASHAYGTIYYVMTGFHGLHVIGGLLAMAALGAGLHARDSALPPVRTVRTLGYYWHFVDVVWVVLFATIFLLR